MKLALAIVCAFALTSPALAAPASSPTPAAAAAKPAPDFWDQLANAGRIHDRQLEAIEKEWQNARTFIDAVFGPACAAHGGLSGVAPAAPGVASITCKDGSQLKETIR